MCKIGDIIGVPRYFGQDGEEVAFHYFVVVSDESGKICGFNFDIVGTVMSSFKDENQRKYKSSFEENVKITESEFDLGNRNKKDGFIKADQLFYFDKTKTNYFVVGQVDGDVLISLLERIGYLDEKNKLTININNILEELEETSGT